MEENEYENLDQNNILDQDIEEDNKPNIIDIIDGLGKIIESENIKDFVSQYYKNQTQKINADFQSKIKLQEYHLKQAEITKSYEKQRYRQDIIMVTVIISAIIAIICINVFSGTKNEYINSATVGTLLGGIIGYALGRFKRSGKDSSE